MANDWYENTASLTEGTRARADAVEDKFSEIETAFEAFPDKSDLLSGKISYGTTTGSANAYLLTLANITALVDGLEITFKANHANTGAATINVSSLGVKSLKRHNGDPLVAGDIPINKIMSFRYNSTSGYFETEQPTAAALAAATAAANYKGAWSGLTGALATPASVSHGGAAYMLTEDLADVTAKQPGVASEWLLIMPIFDTDYFTITTGTVVSNTATTTQEGVSELATSAETITGTDAARTVTPAGVTETLRAKFLL